MALALHAHWLQQTLYLWGERGSGTPSAAREGHPEPVHPRALPAAELRATLGELFADSLLASVAAETNVPLWLPCDAHDPLASPFADEARARAAAPDPAESLLRQMTVPALAFSPSQAMDLLTVLPDSPPAVGGEMLRLADSLRYWGILARFGAGLLARRQFVPQLEQRDAAEQGTEFVAAWHVIVADRTELEWLERFAAAMPASCRAAVGPADEAADAARLVEGFLAAVADAMVRRCVADDEFFRSAERRAIEPFAPPETRWMAALLRSDPVVTGSISETSLLAQQVEGWVAQLEPSQAASLMRLSFRLEEPDESDDVDESPEQVEAALAAAEATEGDEDPDGNGEAIASPAAAPAAAAPATRPWRLRLALEGPDDHTPPVETAELWQDGTESAILGRNLKSQRGQFLAELARAAQLFPQAAGLLLRPAPSELLLSTTEAYAFIRQWSPQLREAGFGVVLPPWAYDSTSELGLRLVVRPSDLDGFPGAPWPEDEPMEGRGGPRRPRGGAELVSGRFGLDSLLEFNWQVAVGDLRLSADEFRSLAATPTPLVKLRGRWVQIDTAAAARAVEFLRKQHEERGGKISLGDALRTAYGASRTDTGLRVLGLEGSSWIESLLEQAPGTKVESFGQPPDFKGTLRPYQLRGLQWLAFIDRIGIGGCLADDMGLGKTIQLIALLQHERLNLPKNDNGSGSDSDARNALGPTLLFAPTSVVGNWVREIERFAPAIRVLIHHGPERLGGDAFVLEAVKHDIVITSYALAHRDKEELGRIAWRRIALDEAQKIKNPSAASTIAIRALIAPRRLAMTGTPIENHLSELWSIMEILNPGLLGSAADFRERFAVPVEKLGDKERAEQLRRLIRPFVLRRLKSDPEIAGDLPEKMESRIFCNLTPEQAALYERVVAESLHQIDAATGIRRRGLILSVLTRLKQICDHPSLLLKEKAAIGGPLPPLDGRSGKCERLVEMLEEVLEEGDGALIFTQFREMGHLLERVLAERLRVPTLFLHGGTPAKGRDAMVEKFQDPAGGVKLFILSLRAGGLGLNLTAANHVFHFDRWWNPAVEAQATDRAHRVGQTRQVQVHKFVCIGTMEERIDRLLTEKLALADKIIGSGDDWLTGLSTDQLREYLTLSREAVGEF